MDGDEPTGGAHRFHDGDGRLFFVEQGRQGALNAQPGDHQDKKPHQFQEKEKIVQEPLDHGPGRQVGVDAFRGIRGGLFQPAGNGIHRKRIQHLDQHLVPDAAAGGQKAQGVQVRAVDEYPRAEGKQIQGPVRFGRHHAGNRQGGVADLQGIPRHQPGAIQQDLFHDAGARGQHLPEGTARREGDLAVKRVARRHHFQPGQHGCRLFRCAHHTVEFVNGGPFDPALIRQPVNGLFQRRGDGIKGPDDNIGGMQAAGIV